MDGYETDRTITWREKEIGKIKQGTSSIEDYIEKEAFFPAFFLHVYYYIFR